MTPLSRHAGRKVRCPDCETLCPIPTIEQIRERLRDELLSAPARPSGQTPYRLQEQSDTVQPTYRVFTQLASIHREALPEPPESLFFSAVFNFPWRSWSAFVRWAMVSIGFSLVGLMLWMSLYLLREYGFLGAIAGGSAILGVAVIGLLACGFAASCGLFILQETAAGVDVIDDWPADGWRDGLFDAVLILWLHATSGFFCYLFGLIMSPLTGSLMPPLLALHVLLFPLTLVSAMDSESAWLPYSGRVIRSLYRLARTWFLFSVISGFFLLAVGGGYLLLVEKLPFVGALALGPFAGTVVFIYSRLVGRVAWKIGDEFSALEDGDSDPLTG